ncbi:MAG TPA: TIR domain-containing protein [Chthoniobacteraceae bacterium]|nr:TIR domain-containing protein [Chthoniobacteraceae bacterium]
MKRISKATSINIKPPRVFISYTHENPIHKAWVLKLATDLRKNGVDAILDQWECKYGSDLTLFMENGIRTSDRVLLVCTPTYQKKANSGTGGVGYERLVVTAEIAKNIKTEKFICVIRSGDDNAAIPTFAGNRLFLDFRNNESYEDNLSELLRDIHIVPLNPKPPIGTSPFGVPNTNTKRLITTSSEAPSSRHAKEKPPLGDNPFTPQVIAALNSPIRNRMPETRMSLTHKFEIAGHEGFITVGLFENGKPGEIFVKMSKEGSTIGGLMDTVATLSSIALQYGVPLESLVKKFAFQRFEPSGFTKNPDIRNATSITDYVFRWLGCHFIKGYKEATSPNSHQSNLPFKSVAVTEKKTLNNPVFEVSRGSAKHVSNHPSKQKPSKIKDSSNKKQKRIP